MNKYSSLLNKVNLFYKLAVDAIYSEQAVNAEYDDNNGVFTPIDKDTDVETLKNELADAKTELQNWRAGQQELGVMISKLNKDTSMDSSKKKAELDKLNQSLAANKRWQATFNGRINILNSFLRAKGEATSGSTTSTSNLSSGRINPEIQKILGVKNDGHLGPETRKAIEAKKSEVAKQLGLQAKDIPDNNLFNHLLTGSPVFPTQSFQQAQPTTAPTATTIPPGLQGFIPSTPTQSFQQAQPSATPAVDFNTVYNQYIQQLQKQQKP